METIENEQSENKKETSKKLLLIFIVLIFFASFYLLYGKGQVNTAKSTKKIPISTAKADLSSKVKTISTIKNGIKKTELQKPKIVAKSYLSPTAKTALISQARLNAGKKDPFVDTTGQSKEIPSSNINNFLPAPPSLDGLPVMNSSGIEPVQVIVYEPVSLKGFIGNKVIIEVDGETESISKNETFKGIKVLNIDARNLSAKFQKNGETLVRKIETVSNKNLKIIGKTF